jgi:hypothetical protein
MEFCFSYRSSLPRSTKNVACNSLKNDTSIESGVVKVSQRLFCDIFMPPGGVVVVVVGSWLT